MPDDEKPQYVKFSISLRHDVYEQLTELMKLTGLDRSGAISLAITRLSREEREKGRRGTEDNT